MTFYNTQSVLAQIQAALERDDLNAALKILETLRSPDQADVFTELEEEEQIALLPKLAPAVSADILEELEDERAAELVSALSPSNAVRIVDQMAPDEAADLLGDLEQTKAKAILSNMENPEEVEPLLLHADETAGGLMTSEFLALRRRMTAADALQAIRNWKPDDDLVYYLFVVDGEGHLCGVVSLRTLVSADPATRLIDIMDPEVISVQAGKDQEEVAQIIQRYDLLALPVVDHEHKLIGVITVDDVMEVIEDETTEDIHRMGGAEPFDQPYLDTKVSLITRKRVGWLMLLFVTESLTGTVLRHFQNELQTVVALSFFVPLLIGTGGNAGSQTTATIIRALALREINVTDALKSLWHEFRIGLLLGLGMGVIGYLRALTWGSVQGLAATVSISLLAIVLWANILGALLPLFAARMKIDPTVVSGPVMSTLVDATGLFIYFTVAHIVLHI
jgi:magnesium transporter